MKNHIYAALCTTALLAMVTLAPAPPADAQTASVHHPIAIPVAEIGPDEEFLVKLTDLYCANANEDDWWSDGDEPYVIVATIRPGSDGIPVLRYFITSIFHNVDAGDNRQPDLAVFSGHAESPVAVVAQVVEHDSTSKDYVFDVAKAFADAHFSRAIREGERNVWTLSEIVADAVRQGVNAIDDPNLDDDDRIGSPARILFSAGNLDNLAAGGIPVGVQREVGGNGARYNMTFKLWRTR
jgi:hypothetical protein